MRDKPVAITKKLFKTITSYNDLRTQFGIIYGKQRLGSHITLLRNGGCSDMPAVGTALIEEAYKDIRDRRYNVVCPIILLNHHWIFQPEYRDTAYQQLLKNCQSWIKWLSRKALGPQRFYGIVRLYTCDHMGYNVKKRIMLASIYIKPDRAYKDFKVHRLKIQ